MNEHERIVFPPSKPKKDPINDMSDALVEFTGENNYTAEEIEEAYYRTMNVSENRENGERLAPLITKMREMQAAGYPVNRLVDLIHITRKVESAVPTYLAYVDTLPVSDNEKRVLRSIIEKRRTGTLEIIFNEQTYESMKVVGEEDPDVIAMEILGTLKKAMARQSITPKHKLGISFVS